MTTTTTDRIEKKVLLRHPRAKVWRALTDAGEFGAWFGANLTGTFRPGASVKGPITHEKYRHVVMDITIERMDPERLVSWRWHPNATEKGRDYSAEPTTLVEFTLEDAPGGTMLTVVESGFDRIPAERRADAFRGNEAGWGSQMVAIEKYLDRAS